MATTLATVERNGFRVEVRSTALRLLAVYVVVGLLAAAAGGHVGLSPTDLHGLIPTAWLFADLAVVALLAHEAGHALAGLLVGRRVVGLVLKLGAAVLIERPEPGERGSGPLAGVVVSLAGPAASILVASLYLGSAETLASPAAWAGLLALGDGVLNLLPLTRSTDGVRAIAELADS